MFAGTSREAGLSCCEIDQTWDDWRIIRQLSEYNFVGGSCWLITGREAGRGADDEPLLRDVELIGKVSESVWGADWQSLKSEVDIKDCIDRLGRITDPIGRKIVEKSLTKLMAQALGRKGGSVTSDRKSAASRANGRSGGRPKKQERQDNSMNAADIISDMQLMELDYRDAQFVRAELIEKIDAAIAAAVQAEREACAKVAENSPIAAYADNTPDGIAAAIRARSNGEGRK